MKGKKRNFQEMKSEFIKVHGITRYDYSLTNENTYKNVKTTILIKCNVCGNVFHQRASSHLQGHGCPYCNQRHKFLVCNVGVNDLFDVVVGGVKQKSYEVWKNMIIRCYEKKRRRSWLAYEGCSVCQEWLTFSNFKKWFDKNYIEGYQLDKDILVKGNKIYSPQNCCFVPSRINSLVVNRKNFRGKYPIGVTIKKCAQKIKYIAKFNDVDVRIFCGSFDTPEEAFSAYKQCKESHIKKVAQEYYDKGLITKMVYDALNNYKVEITD